MLNDFKEINLNVQLRQRIYFWWVQSCTVYFGWVRLYLHPRWKPMGFRNGVRTLFKTIYPNLVTTTLTIGRTKQIIKVLFTLPNKKETNHVDKLKSQLEEKKQILKINGTFSKHFVIQLHAQLLFKIKFFIDWQQKAIWILKQLSQRALLYACVIGIGCYHAMFLVVMKTI